MRIPRIYHPEPLEVNCEVFLDEDAANHVGRVLRMTAGQQIELFDGSNLTFNAEITQADKKRVKVRVLASQPDDRESPLHLHLGQVMSRGEKDGIHHPEIDRTRRERNYTLVFGALRRKAGC